jgi:hypothetical protein
VGVAGLVALAPSIQDRQEWRQQWQYIQDASAMYASDSLNRHPSDGALRTEASRYYETLLHIQATLGDFDGMAATYATLPQQLEGPPAVRVQFSTSRPGVDTYIQASGATGTLPKVATLIPFANAPELVRVFGGGFSPGPLTSSKLFVVSTFDRGRNLNVSTMQEHARMSLSVRQLLLAADQNVNSASLFVQARDAAIGSGDLEAVTGVCWVGVVESTKAAAAVLPACQVAAQFSGTNGVEDYAYGLALARVGRFDDAQQMLSADQHYISADFGFDSQLRPEAGKWVQAIANGIDPLNDPDARKKLADQVMGPQGSLATYITLNREEAGKRR